MDDTKSQVSKSKFNLVLGLLVLAIVAIVGLVALNAQTANTNTLVIDNTDTSVAGTYTEGETEDGTLEEPFNYEELEAESNVTNGITTEAGLDF